MDFRAGRNRQQIIEQPVLRLELKGRAVATIVGGKKVFVEQAEIAKFNFRTSNYNRLGVFSLFLIQFGL